MLRRCPLTQVNRRRVRLPASVVYDFMAETIVCTTAPRICSDSGRVGTVAGFVCSTDRFLCSTERFVCT